MDSKGEQPAYDHEVAPPSYTETTSPSSYLSSYSASTPSQYYGAQIQDQLRSLTAQIRSAQGHISSVQHGNDERILALLAAEVQDFFSGFANSGRQRGTLILVPAVSVSTGATPMEYDFRDPEEYDQVVRVRSKEDIGSGEWFWRDDDMAQRLARYLSPTPSWKDLPSRTTGGSPDGPDSNAQPPRKTPETQRERTSTKAMQKQSRGLFGFRQKGTITSIERPPTLDEREAKAASDAKLANERSKDEVILNVKAEEVSFRAENDMGIFETQRGWSVVLKVRVEMGRR